MKKLWAFSGRIPCKHMELIEVVKGLEHAFFHDNTRPFCNTRDVLKWYRGTRDHEPHIKHYLHMTQTQLYEILQVFHLELRLCQRYFEKCKPWYVRINTIHNTTVVDTTWSLIIITIHFYIYDDFCILTMCRNTQVQHHPFHREISYIPSCVQGKTSKQIMQNNV